MDLTMDLRTEKYKAELKQKEIIVVFISIFVAVLISLASLYYFLYIENKNLAEGLVVYEAESTMLEGKLIEHKSLKEKLEVLDGKSQNIAEIKSNTVIWSKHLNGLRNVLPGNLSVKSVKSEEGEEDKKLIITGSGNTVKDIVDFKVKLSSKKFSPKIESVTQTGTEDDYLYSFLIKAHILGKNP